MCNYTICAAHIYYYFFSFRRAGCTAHGHRLYLFNSVCFLFKFFMYLKSLLELEFEVLLDI